MHHIMKVISRCMPKRKRRNRATAGRRKIKSNEGGSRKKSVGPRRSNSDRRVKVKPACKPGSVQGREPLRQSFLWADGYPAAQATYPGAARATLSLPYLVLLRMGFGMPSLLPGPRWALTPPFHHRRSCTLRRSCGAFVPLFFNETLPPVGGKSRRAGLRQTILCSTFHRLAASGC